MNRSYPFRHNRGVRLSGYRSKICLSNEISNIYVQVPFTIKRNSEFTDLVSCGGDHDFIFDPILRRSVFPLQTPTACGSIPRRSKLAGVRSHPKKSHAPRRESWKRNLAICHHSIQGFRIFLRVTRRFDRQDVNKDMK